MTIKAVSQEHQYLGLLQRTRKGRISGNRTATQTIKTRGERMVFNLAGGYVPLLSTKQIFLKPLIHELLWFLAGNTSNATLRALGVKIWNEWATDEVLGEEEVLLLIQRIELVAINSGLEGNYVECITLREALTKHLTNKLDRAPTDDELHTEIDSVGIPRTKRPVLQAADELGPIYGAQWRRFPAGTYFRSMRAAEVFAYIDNMAPDQLAELRELMREFGNDWEKMYAFAKSEDGRFVVADLKNALSQIGIDQIAQALYKLKIEPLSRQNIVTAWNPQVLPAFVTPEGKLTSQENVARGRAALPACHTFFQLLCDELTESERMDLVDYTDLKERGGYGTVGIVNLQKLYHMRVSDMTSENEHGDAVFNARYQAYAKSLYEDFKGDPKVASLSKASSIGEGSYYRPNKVEGDYYHIKGDVGTGLMLELLGIPKHRLHLELYQRSGDVFLGVPFNIASYSILLHMLAAQANMAPGEFIWMCGDSHLYQNHLDQVALQLSREVKESVPTIRLNPEVKSLFEYTFEDINIDGYDYHPSIKAPVAV